MPTPGMTCGASTPTTACIRKAECERRPCSSELNVACGHRRVRLELEVAVDDAGNLGDGLDFLQILRVAHGIGLGQQHISGGVEDENDVAVGHHARARPQTLVIGQQHFFCRLHDLGLCADGDIEMHLLQHDEIPAAVGGIFSQCQDHPAGTFEIPLNLAVVQMEAVGDFDGARAAVRRAAVALGGLHLAEQVVFLRGGRCAGGGRLRHAGFIRVFLHPAGDVGMILLAEGFPAHDELLSVIGALQRDVVSRHGGDFGLQQCAGEADKDPCLQHRLCAGKEDQQREERRSHSGWEWIRQAAAEFAAVVIRPRAGGWHPH